MDRQVLILLNPRAGPRMQKPLIEALREGLQAKRFEARICTALSEFSEQAAALATTGALHAVVAAGGDGTVMAAAQRVAAGIPLAILPLGTENLLARHFRLPRSPPRLVDLLESGRTVDLNMGEANGQPFLLMLGCGFDAQVVARVHQQRTGNIRHWAYAKPIWDTIRSYHYPEVRIYWEPGEVTPPRPPLAARWAFVANMPDYACGLRIVPQAEGSDGLLDVCAFRRGNWNHGLRYLLSVIRQRQQFEPDCTMLKACRVRIESDEPVPYQLDGDPGGLLPVSVRCLPGRFRLFVGGPAGAGPNSHLS